MDTACLSTYPVYDFVYPVASEHALSSSVGLELPQGLIRKVLDAFVESPASRLLKLDLVSLPSMSFLRERVSGWLPTR